MLLLLEFVVAVVTVSRVRIRGIKIRLFFVTCYFVYFVYLFYNCQSSSNHRTTTNLQSKKIYIQQIFRLVRKFNNLSDNHVVGVQLFHVVEFIIKLC